MKIIFYVFISFLITNIFTDDQLRWTFELVNHGARTPRNLDSNLTDFMNHTWIGQNELTGVGLRQSFLIGFRDRLRYIEEKQLISDIYDPREIFVYSSENNKTLMSANALLHGLFLPGTGPQINESLVDSAVPPVDPSSYQEEKEELDSDNYTALPGRMNLVPVHISFSHEYFMQFENSKKCKGVKQYEEKNKNRDEVKEFLKKMTEKYGKNLIKIFPDKDSNLLKDYEFAYKVFDTIVCLYYDGADEFNTLLKTLNVTEKELLDDSYEFLRKNTVGNGINNDKDFINYLVSPMFDKILSFMDYRIQKDSAEDMDYRGYDLPKYFMLSGIANTLGAFMSFMNKVFGTEIKYANFSTNLHLELYLENDKIENITEKDYRLEYFYNDDFLLSVPYTEFKQKIKKNLKSQNDVLSFCKDEKNDEDNSDLWYIIGTIICVIVLIVCLVFIVITFKKRIKTNKIETVEEKEGLIRETNRTSNESGN